MASRAGPKGVSAMPEIPYEAIVRLLLENLVVLLLGLFFIWKQHKREKKKLLLEKQLLEKSEDTQNTK